MVISLQATAEFSVVDMAVLPNLLRVKLVKIRILWRGSRLSLALKLIEKDILIRVYLVIFDFEKYLSNFVYIYFSYWFTIFLFRTVHKAVKFVQEDRKSRLSHLAWLSLFKHTFAWCLWTSSIWHRWGQVRVWHGRGVYGFRFDGNEIVDG